MPDQHAKILQPSASARWLACPPSARLHARFIELFGEEESPYAAEGTQAHSLCELKLRRALELISQEEYDTSYMALRSPRATAIRWYSHLLLRSAASVWTTMVCGL